MLKEKIVKICKNQSLILSLILLVFFLKGVFFTTANPMFTGQDESRHYATVQYRAEPKDKNWEKIDRPLGSIKKENIADYNFSQEMIRAGEAADFDIFRHQLYNTVNFSDNYNGIRENEINQKIWKPINFFQQPDVVGGNDLYYLLATSIEKILGTENILIRFFANRIFSVFLGTIGIFLAYLIIRNVGLDKKASLILSAIIAFQPRYSMYFANINYDVLLIPLFFLFTLGAILSLRHSFNWKNGLVMLLAIGLGFFTKPTALILLLPFFALIFYFLYKNYKKAIDLKIILLAVIIFFALAYFSNYNFISILPFKNNLSETIRSLSNYLSESLTFGRFALSSRTYWGSLGWNSNFIDQNFTDFIWIIETLSAIGLIWFLFSKKKINFLPEKKYIIFLLGMIVALQFGIRMADWKVFISYGEELALGTPGRYFLPNLVSHIILVFVGLGMLFRKENYFKNILLGGLILMLSFSTYLIFNIIIPRYYL